MDHKKLIFPAILLAGVTACSDDDDSNSNTESKPETEPTSYSVTAIDGYLRSADVWLDINGNFILDGDEPKATTGEHGVAVLDTTGIENPEQYPVVVEAKEAITVDEDDIDPNTELGGEVTHSYAMSAPAGEKNITPLSTQVHLKMVHGMAKEDAINQVANSLGLKAEGLLADFIAPATANAANAYAASNIVDSQSLPTDAKELHAVAVPGSQEAQNYANTTAAVNETIKATVDATNEAGGDFTKADDVFDPSSDAELDTDVDGVPDHIDAFPADKGRYLPSDKLAYTTWYMGTQVISSKDNPGEVYTDANKHFTGTTAGKPTWFYTPMNAKFRLSALADYQYNVQFDGDHFTNIYVTPISRAAYHRINCFASTVSGTPLRDTENFRYRNEPWNDTYVISVHSGRTLNSTLKEINKDLNNNGKGCEGQTISKADFLVLEYFDAPSKIDRDDPEVTRGNFILKIGDSAADTGTDKPFTIDAYDMAKTYQIGNGPEIVVANAVGVKQETTDSALTGESYGKRVWIYPASVGGESTAPYAVIAPLSDYQDFSFATEHKAAFVLVYVVAKGDKIFDESDVVPGVFEPVDGTERLQPDGKQVYKIMMTGGAGSLKDSLLAAGRTVDELELINFVDNPIDGDLGVVGNFILKMGNAEDSYEDSDAADGFEDNFTVSEFTFSAPAAN